MKMPAFSIACIRGVLDSADSPVRAELRAPSPAARTAGELEQRAALDIEAGAWSDVRKAARVTCAPGIQKAKGQEPYARLLGADVAAATYATRDGELLSVANDGSRRATTFGPDTKELRGAWVDARRARALLAGASGVAYLASTESPPAFARESLGGDSQVVRALFAADGMSLFVARRGGQGELWALAPLKRLAQFRLEFPEAAALSPDGRWLAVMRGGLVEYADTRDGVVKGKSQAKLPFNHVEFGPDSTQAVLSSQSGNVYVASVPDGRVGRTLAHEGAAVEAHFIGPQHVVTAAFDGAVRVFGTVEEGGALVVEPLLHRGPVIFARPAGRSKGALRIVSLADDQVLRVWRASLTPPSSTRGPVQTSPILDFARDGGTFARVDRAGMVQVGGIDTTLRNADTNDLRTFGVAEPGASIRRVRLDDDGGMIAWGLDNGVLGWRATRGGEVFAVPRVRLPAPATDLAFSGEAKLLAALLQDRGIRVIDVVTARPTGLAIDAGEGAIAWGFSRNGDRILVALPQRLQSFDARTGIGLASASMSGIVSADVNPRAPEIAHSRGRDVAIWNAEASASSRTRAMPTFVTSVRFSRDGAKLLTLSVDGNVRVLDSATLADLGAPLRHSFSVVKAEFAPDARWVVTTALDGVVRIWDYSTGQVIATATKRGEPLVGSALLLGRNNWLALVGGDGAIDWMPVAIGFPQPLPEWFGAAFASISGLAGIEEPAPAVERGGAAKPGAEWEAWWRVWRDYVADRRNLGG